MKKYRSFLIAQLSLVLTVVAVGSAKAEVACSSEISYRWSKDNNANPAIEAEAEGIKATAAPLSPETTPTPSAEGGSPAVADTQTAQSAEGVAAKGELTVRFASLERRGGDEATVKAGLAPELNRQKARAYERCRRDHEAFGDCVSTKLSVKTSTLNSLSFSARAAVEQALMDECKAQQGRCVGVYSSEVKCREVGVAPAKAEASPAAAAPEGDAKAASEQAPKTAEGEAKKPKTAKK